MPRFRVSGLTSRGPEPSGFRVQVLESGSLVWEVAKFGWLRLKSFRLRGRHRRFRGFCFGVQGLDLLARGFLRADSLGSRKF